MTEIEIIKMVMSHEGNQYAQSKLTNYFSKWGISARTHAHIDLRNLTEVEAIAIHKKDFYGFYKFKDLPVKIRPIIYEIGIILSFQDAFRMLSQAAEYFPLREELRPELLVKIDTFVEVETLRARAGTLLILWLSDHGLLQQNIRSLVPRILMAVSS